MASRPRTRSREPLDSASSMRLVVLVGCAVTIAAALIFLPLNQILFSFVKLAGRPGPLGPLMLAAAYVPASLFFLPGVILAVTGGFLFGVGLGTAAVSIGSTLGATAAFLAGRTLGRTLVEAGVARNPRFAAIDRALTRQGFKLVLLARLSLLIPFNALNYVLGLSALSTPDYVLGSWLGMLPGTVIYVYLGSLLKVMAESGEPRMPSPRQLIPFAVGLVVSVAVTIVVGVITKRAMDEAAAESRGGPSTSTVTRRR